MLAGLQHGLQGPEAHEAWHGAHHQVRALDGRGDLPGVGEVAGRHLEAPGFEPGQGGLGKVGHGDVEFPVPGEVQGQGRAHAAGSEHGDPLHGKSSAAVFWKTHSSRSAAGSGGRTRVP